MHKARLDDSMTPLGLQMSGYEFEITIQISFSDTHSQTFCKDDLCENAFHHTPLMQSVSTLWYFDFKVSKGKTKRSFKCW